MSTCNNAIRAAEMRLQAPAAQRNRLPMWCRRALGLALMVGGIGTATQSEGATFSEPHTIFYGKVLGTASAQDFLITEGELSWTIVRSDGHEISLNTELFPLGDGAFSYRLHVPHAAFTLGLNHTQDGIPMPPTPQTHVHSAVHVDADVATLLGPASAAFTTEQLLRTATYRMDLGVGRQAVDSDGDGIPDWWEDLYGLDKQDASDAHIDFSGDGITALQAYLRGLDPMRDNRAPMLLTEELLVYASGTTAVALDAADLDSSATQLIYTLTDVPHAGELRLRNAQSNPDSPDAVLTVGMTFTQTDLLNGRVVYQHDGSVGDPGSFSVALRDENPEHPDYTGDIQLLVYQPSEEVPLELTTLESRRLDAYFHAQQGAIIFDATGLPADTAVANPSAGLSLAALDAYVTSYGDDRAYMFIAGSEPMVVSGGHRNDILVATKGTGTLTGGSGADLFVFESLKSGRVTISDFAPSEGDVIDLSRLSPTGGTYVHQYVRLVPVTGGYDLQLGLGGTGSGYTNLTVALPGLSANNADLYTLIEGGHLLVGNLPLEPRISVVASEPRAAQSGPTAGRYTIQRQGSPAGDLTVNLTHSGTAVNGSDYQLLSSMVILPEGVREVDVELMPYVTGHQGPEKVAQLTLSSGTGYRVGLPSSAMITIENLVMVVELEVLHDIAVVDDNTSAVIRLRRRHVTNTDALIRLSMSGTAKNGTDYDSIPTFVTMSPGQTQMLIEVKPKQTATWSGGAKSVKVTVLPDDDYLVKDNAGTAQVALVKRLDSLAAWQSREFEGSTDDLATFAASDSGNRGITHLQRYAFGLDPHTPDRSGLPQPFLLNGRLVVTFRQPLSVQNDVVYRVHARTDLVKPDATVLPMTRIPAPSGSTDPERVYYAVGEAADHVSTLFSIVEVEWIP